MLKVLINEDWQLYMPAILFTIWALLHSFFADPGIKKRIRRQIGNSFFRWYRLVYVLVSALTLCGIFRLLYLRPGSIIWQAEAWLYSFMNGLRLIALIMFLVVTATLNMKDFLGITAVLNTNEVSDSARENGLVIKGAYGIVRHPLYSLGFILFWANPMMTSGNLAFAVCASLYLWLGTYHEEASLRKEFGNSYLEYCRNVPRLVPNPFRKKH